MDEKSLSFGCSRAGSCTFSPHGPKCSALEPALNPFAPLTTIASSRSYGYMSRSDEWETALCPTRFIPKVQVDVSPHSDEMASPEEDSGSPPPPPASHAFEPADPPPLPPRCDGDDCAPPAPPAEHQLPATVAHPLDVDPFRADWAHR